jgi:sigma-E factor negative regulatory protein RseA
MSDHDKQTLSAMLDDEAGELELRRLIKSLDDNPGIADTWRRYSLVQSILHGHEVHTGKSAISARVATAIAAEANPAARHWGLNGGRFALAASVAVLVFLGLQSALVPDTQAPAQMAQQSLSVESSTSPVAAVSSVEVPVRRDVDPVAMQLLEEYISRVAITHEPPTQLEYIQDSPLYRLVNESLPALPDR